MGIFRADRLGREHAIRAVGTDHVHELTSRPKRFPCVVPVDELLTIDSILNSEARATDERNFCGRGGPPPLTSVRSEYAGWDHWRRVVLQTKRLFEPGTEGPKGSEEGSVVPPKMIMLVPMMVAPWNARHGGVMAAAVMQTKV